MLRKNPLHDFTCNEGVVGEGQMISHQLVVLSARCRPGTEYPTLTPRGLLPSPNTPAWLSRTTGRCCQWRGYPLTPPRSWSEGPTPPYLCWQFPSLRETVRLNRCREGGKLNWPRSREDNSARLGHASLDCCYCPCCVIVYIKHGRVKF